MENKRNWMPGDSGTLANGEEATVSLSLSILQVLLVIIVIFITIRHVLWLVISTQLPPDVTHPYTPPPTAVSNPPPRSPSLPARTRGTSAPAPPRRWPPPRANSLMTGAPVHQTCTRRTDVLGIVDRRVRLPGDAFVSGSSRRWNRWLRLTKIIREKLMKLALRYELCYRSLW